MLFYLWIIVVIGFDSITAEGLFKTTRKWSFLEYKYESEQQREKIMADKNILNQISIPSVFEVQVGLDNETYVTVLSKKGDPAKLVKVSSIISTGGPLVEAHPRWNEDIWNENCYESIIDPFHMTVDECNRTWILDSGKFESGQKCHPSLVLYHADIGVMKAWELPVMDYMLIDSGRLSSLIVEVDPGSCEKFHIYMGNMDTNQLVIFNGLFFWTDNSLKYENRNGYGKLSIAGENFELDWGIGSFALSPASPNNERKLFFRFLTSLDILSVPTSQLHDSWEHGRLMDYQIDRDVLPSPVISMTFSPEGILYFGLTKEMAIGCWDMNHKLTNENIKILDTDPEAYQFISGMKIIPKQITGNDDELWIVSNRYQKSILNNRNISEINFRIITANLVELDDKCKHNSSE